MIPPEWLYAFSRNWLFGFYPTRSRITA